MMVPLVAQIAPQRSTQYSDLAAVLAPHELRLCPLGAQVANLQELSLAGQQYLRFDLPSEPDETARRELGWLAAISAAFRYYEQIGDQPGPFLRPLSIVQQPHLPAELVMARRYRGKTNELFTHFLLNIARYSSKFAQLGWADLRVFDPLAGGGTTLFTALVLGAEAAGVEHNAEDVKSTVAFVRQFAREEGIRCQVKEERLRKLGWRWAMSLGKEPPRRCILALGDTLQSPALVAGFKPHLIVADLPYGIQHQGAVESLLTQAVPVWASMLPPGGALVFAWDATRLLREQVIAHVSTAASLLILNTPPYDTLAHRVDRVIKQRDVLVARRV
jgi:hypothetical protein